MKRPENLSHMDLHLVKDSKDDKVRKDALSDLVSMKNDLSPDVQYEVEVSLHRLNLW